LHLLGILFPHINDDARSKSHQNKIQICLVVNCQRIILQNNSSCEFDSLFGIRRFIAVKDETGIPKIFQCLRLKLHNISGSRSVFSGGKRRTGTWYGGPLEKADL